MKKKKRKQHETCKIVHPESEYFSNVTSFLLGFIMLSLNLFCNISSYDILAYITNYYAFCNLFL